MPKKICFIGGTGRSGSTILKLIFSKHPDVTRVNELRFAIDPDGLIDFYRSFEDGWSPYHWDTRLQALERMLKALSSSSYLLKALAVMNAKLNMHRKLPFSVMPRYAGLSASEYAPNYDRLTTRLIERLGGLDYSGQWNGTRLFGRNRIRAGSPEILADLAAIIGSYWRDVLYDMCDAQGKEIYLDDNTWCILWFDKIMELLPEARLVHIYRDPRDVVASYTTMRWAPADAGDAAIWYKGLMNRWTAAQSRVPEGSYLEISLEDLVRDTTPVLHRLCEFWQIPWHDSLLETKLDKSHTGRWRSDFSETDQRRINQLLREELRSLGYDGDPV